MVVSGPVSSESVWSERCHVTDHDKSRDRAILLMREVLLLLDAGHEDMAAVHVQWAIDLLGKGAGSSRRGGEPIVDILDW